MRFKCITAMSTLAFAIAAGACNRTAEDTRDAAAKAESKVADEAAEIARKRNDDVARLNERVAQVERDYAEKNAELASGKRTATASLREEVQEDVANVKTAVANLGTTTADNWWEREEEAIRRTADDVAADVKRFSSTFAEAAPEAIGPSSATAPFASRRDAFVAQLRGRVKTFEHALEGVKAKGTRETELDDTRARVKKLSEDLDKLAAASPEDWWSVARTRVTEYVDRVEASVKRLNDNTPKS